MTTIPNDIANYFATPNHIATPNCIEFPYHETVFHIFDRIASC